MEAEMSEEYRIMLINKAIAKAMILAQGYTAQNLNQQSRGLTPYYDKIDFSALVDEMQAVFEANRQ
jgi:hypothetical protein